MQSIHSQARVAKIRRWGAAIVWLAAVSQATVAAAGPTVAFDFARQAECHDVTPAARLDAYPDERLIEVRLPISVRFHGVAVGDVEQIDVEIDGSPAKLRVHMFSPSTQLASDVVETIETTTTKRKARSLDATLGGQLPVPYAEVVAHVAPSVSVGGSHSEVATEKTSRLPPKRAVVVSGTAHQGQGVFFKLKRSTQTSLEGVHELTIVFVVPAEWAGGGVRITCAARGHRQVLWLKQATTWGSLAATVELLRNEEAASREPTVRTADDSFPPGAVVETMPTAVGPVNFAGQGSPPSDQPAGDDA